MGDADLVKPMLEKLGTVHFGRLNMKPGKPTTFATLNRPANDSQSYGKVLFFGLPGNPVSCLVTKSLFIDPALKKLQGKFSKEVILIIFHEIEQLYSSFRHHVVISVLLYWLIRL